MLRIISSRTMVALGKKVGICSIGMIGALLTDWVTEKNNEERTRKLIRKVLSEQSRMNGRS